MREWKSQSEMVLQISHCVQPKVPKEGDVRKFEKVGKILRELCNQSGVELVEGHGLFTCV